MPARAALALAAVLALAALAGPRPLAAQAEAPDGGQPAPAGHATAWKPVVYTFFLTRAGGEELDPFASAGRREALQLLEVRSPHDGRFARVRLNGGGGADEVMRQEGWYEIRDGRLFLYHFSPDGSLGHVEEGRYYGDAVCLAGPAGQEPLRFEFVPPAEGDLRPPSAPRPEPAEGCPAASGP